MKINKKIAYPFLVIGAIGWISGFIISLSSIQTNFEIPLGAASAVTVDSESNIYVTSRFYSTVQSYDKNGNFLLNWRIPSAGGNLNIKCSQDTIKVFSPKVGAVMNFNQKGELINRKKTKIKSSVFRSESKKFVAPNGDIYELKHGFIWPTVQKNGSDIVTTKLHLWIFQGPFPAFLFVVTGMAISIYVDKGKFFQKH